MSFSAKKLIASAVVFGLLAVPTIANARCLQADLAGNWQAYSMSADGNSGYWTRCRISVGNSGNITDGVCANSFGQSGSLSSGRVILTHNGRCTFEGNFTLGGITNRITHGTLASDGLTANGVGTFRGGVFQFSLTKL